VGLSPDLKRALLEEPSSEFEKEVVRVLDEQNLGVRLMERALPRPRGGRGRGGRGGLDFEGNRRGGGRGPDFPPSLDRGGEPGRRGFDKDRQPL
jgi:hypothetical protein